MMCGCWRGFSKFAFCYLVFFLSRKVRYRWEGSDIHVGICGAGRVLREGAVMASGAVPSVAVPTTGANEQSRALLGGAASTWDTAVGGGVVQGTSLGVV